MIGEKTTIPADVIPESNVAEFIREARKLEEENEMLKEKNEYIIKEIEDAKACAERALCECKELIAKNKRLTEEHNRQNGTIQALNIALDVITDRYSNLRKKLCRTDKDGE